LSKEARTDQRHLDEMGGAMGGYIRGVAFNGLIIGAVAWAGLSLVDVPYAAALGAWTAVAELIPYLGPLFAGALAAGGRTPGVDRDGDRGGGGTNRRQRHEMSSRTGANENALLPSVRSTGAAPDLARNSSEQ
jgi:hypothetical protein